MESLKEITANFSKNSETKPTYVPFLATYDVPRGKIDMNELQKLLMDRLMVLLCVDKLDKSTSLTVEEKRQKLLNILQEKELDLYIHLLENNDQVSEAQYLDYVRQEKLAHIFLNAIFCSWKEKAIWVKQQEVTLFEWQCFNYRPSQVMKFLRVNNLSFPKATRNEKLFFFDKLNRYIEDDDVRKLEDIDMYKISWKIAKKLIESHQVFCHKGTCFVAEEKMKNVLGNLYEKHLANERAYGIYETASVHGLGKVRTLHLRKFIFFIFWIKLRDLHQFQINMNTIEQYLPSFPPCARIIHEELATKWHLKYFSRRQYLLFLKGIGAKVEDVDNLFREYFVTLNGMSLQRYHEYHYFIFHTFGLRGSNIQYETPSCASNIKDIRGFNEVNGCPFANPGYDDIEDLEKTLLRWKISEAEQTDIFHHKTNGECSKACAAYFKAVHETFPKDEILNPLDFYRESRELLKTREKVVPEFEYREMVDYSHVEEFAKNFPEFPDIFSDTLKTEIDNRITDSILTSNRTNWSEERDLEICRVPSVSEDEEMPLIDDTDRKFSVIPKTENFDEKFMWTDEISENPKISENISPNNIDPLTDIMKSEM